MSSTHIELPPVTEWTNIEVPGIEPMLHSQRGQIDSYLYKVSTHSHTISCIYIYIYSPRMLFSPSAAQNLGARDVRRRSPKYAKKRLTALTEVGCIMNDCAYFRRPDEARKPMAREEAPR